MLYFPILKTFYLLIISIINLYRFLLFTIWHFLQNNHFEEEELLPTFLMVIFSKTRRWIPQFNKNWTLGSILSLSFKLLRSPIRIANLSMVDVQLTVTVGGGWRWLGGDGSAAESKLWVVLCVCGGSWSGAAVWARQESRRARKCEIWTYLGLGLRKFSI